MLKPCPFCGSNEVSFEISTDSADSFYQGFIACNSCHAEGPEISGYEAYEECKQAIVDSWNSHVDRDRNEVVQRLRGQLQNCVNYLDKANRGSGRCGSFSPAIESANRALYETLDR